MSDINENEVHQIEEDVKVKRATIAEKLENIEKSERKLAQEQIKLDQRRKALLKAGKAKKREDDTRRKILVGAYFIREEPAADLKIAMNSYLKTDKDRALFDLDPLPAS
mgnify:CR=1 FL=1